MPIRVDLSINAAHDLSFDFQEYGLVNEDSEPYLEILTPQGNQFLLLDKRFMSISENTLSINLTSDFLSCIASAYSGAYRGSYTINIGGEIVFFGDALIAFVV